MLSSRARHFLCRPSRCGAIAWQSSRTKSAQKSENRRTVEKPSLSKTAEEALAAQQSPQPEPTGGKRNNVVEMTIILEEPARHRRRPFFTAPARECDGTFSILPFQWTDRGSPRRLLVEYATPRRELAILQYFDETTRLWSATSPDGGDMLLGAPEITYMFPERAVPYTAQDARSIEEHLRPLLAQALARAKYLWLAYRTQPDNVITLPDAARVLFRADGAVYQNWGKFLPEAEHTTPDDPSSMELYAAFRTLTHLPLHFCPARISRGFRARTEDDIATIVARHAALNDEEGQTRFLVRARRRLAERLAIARTRGERAASAAQGPPPLSQAQSDAEARELFAMLGDVRNEADRIAEDRAQVASAQEPPLDTRDGPDDEGGDPAASGNKWWSPAALEVAAARLSPSELAWDPTGADALRIAALKEFALGEEGIDVADRTVIERILRPLHRGRGFRDAIVLLQDLGVWHGHENLFLMRTVLPRTFPVGAVAAARALNVVGDARRTRQPLDYDADIREDLGAMVAYAIDDASTTEVDDALSVDASDPTRIHIHISDPTRLMRVGSVLDLVGRQRLSTIYMPDSRIAMLPSELGAGALSFRTGEPCHSLTFSARIDPGSGAITGERIYASLLRTVHRVTYDDIEAIISGEPVSPAAAHLGDADRTAILRLFDMSLARKRHRASLGATSLQIAKSEVKLLADEHISVRIENSKTRARELVAEAMIMCGMLCGEHARDNNLFIPFRWQPPPVFPKGYDHKRLQELPPELRDMELARYMLRADVSPVPRPHFSLGFEVYTHVSSPIRRYTDIVNHFQIKARLHGQPPVFPTANSLMSIWPYMSSHISAVRRLQRNSERFWVLTFLARQPRDKEYAATVVDITRDKKNARVMHVVLNDFGVRAKLRTAIVYDRGDVFRVRVSHVAPQIGQLQLTEVANTAVRLRGSEAGVLAVLEDSGHT